MEQGTQEGRQTFDQALANTDSTNNLRLKIRSEEMKRGAAQEEEKPSFRIEGTQPASGFSKVCLLPKRVDSFVGTILMIAQAKT